MKIFSIALGKIVVVFAAFFVVGLPQLSQAEDTSPETSSDPDFLQAKIAIEEKQWVKAISFLNKVLPREPSNADIYNLLGYSERHEGQLDVAFRHYDKALSLDPKHKGAHQYIGEAYLTINKPAKAEEHLAKLKDICGTSCDQYKSLQRKIAEYKRKKN